jgi:hypothetical protein
MTVIPLNWVNFSPAAAVDKRFTLWPSRYSIYHISPHLIRSPAQQVYWAVMDGPCSCRRVLCSTANSWRPDDILLLGLAPRSPILNCGWGKLTSSRAVLVWPDDGSISVHDGRRPIASPAWRAYREEVMFCPRTGASG